MNMAKEFAKNDLFEKIVKIQSDLEQLKSLTDKTMTKNNSLPYGCDLMLEAALLNIDISVKGLEKTEVLCKQIYRIIAENENKKR